MSTPADSRPLLSMVVPAYNEEATLSEIVRRLLAVPEAGEIVGDRSTDSCAVWKTPSALFPRPEARSAPLDGRDGRLCPGDQEAGRGDLCSAMRDAKRRKACA
jgi:hypothetical protein